MSNILLVRPAFTKSKDSRYSIPLGLLKISAYKKSIGDRVYYRNENLFSEDLPKDISEIWVTSTFSYYSSFVVDSADYWHGKYPEAKLYIGGIAATLIPEYFKDNVSYANIIVGYHKEAESFVPDYSILPTDNDEMKNTQIIHTQRSCKYRCPWCYTHVIEPEDIFYNADTVEKRILANPNRKDVLLYDNNFLSNPNNIKILERFIELHRAKKFKFMATQGFKNDLVTEETAKLVKEAGFYYPRFSWDNESQAESAKKCIEYFVNAGYKRKELMIFVIINYNETPKVIAQRYSEIYKLGCQVHSDIYRPADSEYDGSNGDYFINKKYGWTEHHIKELLKLMGNNNLKIRYSSPLIEFS